MKLFTFVILFLAVSFSGCATPGQNQSTDTSYGDIIQIEPSAPGVQGTETRIEAEVKKDRAPTSVNPVSAPVQIKAAIVPEEHPEQI